MKVRILPPALHLRHRTTILFVAKPNVNRTTSGLIPGGSVDQGAAESVTGPVHGQLRGFGFAQDERDGWPERLCADGLMEHQCKPLLEAVFPNRIAVRTAY
jgi:hypothetical protein